MPDDKIELARYEADRYMWKAGTVMTTGAAYASLSILPRFALVPPVVAILGLVLMVACMAGAFSKIRTPEDGIGFHAAMCFLAATIANTASRAELKWVGIAFVLAGTALLVTKVVRTRRRRKAEQAD